MNLDVYNVLKKALANGVFTEYHEICVAEDACRKYEQAQEETKRKREAKAAEMKGLILKVLTEANKPLCPTDMQFIIYRETEKVYSASALAWYCGRLWNDGKLSYQLKRSRTYYFLKG